MAMVKVDLTQKEAQVSTYRSEGTGMPGHDK